MPGAVTVLPTENVSVSMTVAVTLTGFTIAWTVVPLSIAVVYAESEYVVMRTKNVPLAVGFVTTPKVAELDAEGAVVFVVLLAARLSVKLLLSTTNPVPKPEVAVSVVEACANPVGTLQVPAAVVHTWNRTDCIGVAIVAENVKSHVTVAPPIELDDCALLLEI